MAVIRYAKNTIPLLRWCERTFCHKINWTWLITNNKYFLISYLISTYSQHSHRSQLCCHTLGHAYTIVHARWKSERCKTAHDGTQAKMQLHSVPLAFDGAKCSVSCPSNLSPSTHWRESWVCPRVSLTFRWSKKSPPRKQTPDHPAHTHNTKKIEV
jgi:hypothetical protein